jgi:hypothetical protein
MCTTRQICKGIKYLTYVQYCIRICVLLYMRCDMCYTPKYSAFPSIKYTWSLGKCYSWTQHSWLFPSGATLVNSIFPHSLYCSLHPCDHGGRERTGDLLTFCAPFQIVLRNGFANNGMWWALRSLQSCKNKRFV